VTLGRRALCLSGESAGGTVPARATVRPGQDVDLVKRGALDPLNDQLRDAIAALEDRRLAEIVVHENHLYLSAVPGIDGARSVDKCSP
jgi:hypothetical protein